MLKSFIISALRNFRRNGMYSVINVFGLAVGLAGFMIIMIFISGELSYDKHHPDYRNTYRVAMDLEMSGNITRAAVSGGTLGKLMNEEIKGVRSYTRFVHYPRSILFDSGDKKINFNDILYCDSSFFEFFSYKVLQGDLQTALTEPYSLVLTSAGAKRLFGEKDPIGRSVLFDGQDSYVVRAVIEDPMKATHIQFDALASFSSLESIAPYDRFINTLFAFVTFNYVKLHSGFKPEDISAPLDSLVQRHMGEGMKDSGAGFKFYLQPVQDIYLHSHLRHELRSNGDVNNLYIFSAIAFFILIIAAINFITLTTARSVKRSMEVGIRKVFGAQRRGLIIQFVGEAVITALLSVILSILLIELLLPEVSRLAGSELMIWMGDFRSYISLLLGLAVVVGAISGVYPAYVISAYKPSGIIQKRLRGGKRTSWFRNAMVVLQFMITIFLVCGTIVIYLQLAYMKDRDSGITLEDRLIIPLRGGKMISKYETVKSGFMGISGVESITASSAYPGNFRQRAGFYPEGSSRDDMWMLQNVQVDHNYFEVMEIKLLEGSAFSENPEVDSLNVIVNEALVKEAGWEHAIGKFVGIPMGDAANDIKLKVIGVVADFNYASLHESIKPLLIMHDPARLANICVHLTPGSESMALEEMEGLWNEMFPGQPFSYFFLKEDFNRLYATDVKLSQVFTWFTILAVIIACMGLFGLSSYMTIERTREIGIRKVLGASSSQLVRMLIKTFVLLIIVAAMLAIPLAWYGMHEWLQNFAHQTSLSWWIFPLAIIIALAIAVITVIFQSLRAANKNPVDAIRWE